MFKANAGVPQAPKAMISCRRHADMRTVLLQPRERHRKQSVRYEKTGHIMPAEIKYHDYGGTILLIIYWNNQLKQTRIRPTLNRIRHSFVLKF